MTLAINLNRSLSLEVPLKSMLCLSFDTCYATSSEEHTGVIPYEGGPHLGVLYPTISDFDNFFACSLGPVS